MATLSQIWGQKTYRKNLNFHRRAISVSEYMFYSMTNLLLFANRNETIICIILCV